MKKFTTVNVQVIKVYAVQVEAENNEDAVEKVELMSSIEIGKRGILRDIVVGNAEAV